jgi:hypothetical protein
MKSRAMNKTTCNSLAQFLRTRQRLIWDSALRGTFCKGRNKQKRLAKEQG